MQTLQPVFRIDETERKDNLLEIVSDKYCRTILKSVLEKPKSILEISSEENIPISTTYRRIQTLHENKLLETSGTITDDGKRLFLYKSKIKGIQSTFNDGQVEVKLIPSN